MDQTVSPNHYGIPLKTHRKFHQNRWNRLGGVCPLTYAQKKYIYIYIYIDFFFFSSFAIQASRASICLLCAYNVIFISGKLNTSEEEEEDDFAPLHIVNTDIGEMPEGAQLSDGEEADSRPNDDPHRALDINLDEYVSPFISKDKNAYFFILFICVYSLN